MLEEVVDVGGQGNPASRSGKFILATNISPRRRSRYHAVTEQPPNRRRAQVQISLLKVRKPDFGPNSLPVMSGKICRLSGKTRTDSAGESGQRRRRRPTRAEFLRRFEPTPLEGKQHEVRPALDVQLALEAGAVGFHSFDAD